MEEPSLLDYLKAKLSLKALFKGGAYVQIPSPTEEEKAVQPEVKLEEAPHRRGIFTKFPWRSLLALGLALIAQRAFEPMNSHPGWGGLFYFAAFCTLIFALWKGEWQKAAVPDEATGIPERKVNKTPIYALVPLIVLSYIAFSGNRFTPLNIFLWILTFIAGLAAFWQREHRMGWANTRERILGFLRKPQFTIRFSYWWLLVVGVFCLAAYFHLSQLSTVPLDMTSDHAEKLLDMNDVMSGSAPIFFNRNAGREPIQFYWTALLIKLFNLDLGFTTLKLGMALAFLISLIYVYKLGKEVGNRWTGLFAVLLLGMAAWTNIIARVGMRLVLTPVFVAPTLFYLLRGIRTQRRNDFILSGIFLGWGLMGYSAFRIVPFVAALGVLIYLAHRRRHASNAHLFGDFSLLVLFAVVAALPLLRFALQYPDLIGMRTLTRMTGAEQAIQGPVYKVFFQNVWNALIMPFWKDGNTWVIAITGRPALDLVSAALYMLGVVLLIFSWIKGRNWQYLFLLISIPVLMLPSIMALAFPIENPSLSRAGGAVIPVILICAIALETLLSSLWKKAKNVTGKGLVIILAGAMVLASGRQNYDLVFNQYGTQYINATWNSMQMGKIARDFIGSVGSPDTVYVVAKAHWVDTRLVAMNAGYITRDYQIWPEDLNNTLAEQRTKLFFVKADDEVGMNALRTTYPNGTRTLHRAAAPGRDFYTYLVPALVDEQ
jgi:hypothetical protein